MIKFMRHGRAGPGRLLDLTRNVRDTMVRGVLRKTATVQPPGCPQHAGHTLWPARNRHGQAGRWTTDTILYSKACALCMPSADYIQS